jgi:hypothetical protein
MHKLGDTAPADKVWVLEYETVETSNIQLPLLDIARNCYYDQPVEKALRKIQKVTAKVVCYVCLTQANKSDVKPYYERHLVEWTEERQTAMLSICETGPEVAARIRKKLAPQNLTSALGESDRNRAVVAYTPPSTGKHNLP